MGAENLCIYIYIISYSYNHMKSAVFCSKISMIVILILYNSSINNKLIKKHVLDTIFTVFPPFHQQKIIPNTVLCLWATWQWFVPEWINRLNDSVQSQWLGSVTMIQFSHNDSVQSQWFSSVTMIRFNHNDSVQSQWFGSITMTHLLTVTCCHLLEVLISHLKYLFILKEF